MKYNRKLLKNCVCLRLDPLLHLLNITFQVDPTSNNRFHITGNMQDVYTVDIDNGTQLVIESITYTDVGEYRCEARGNVEFISKTTTVYLFGRLSVSLLYESI